MGILSSKLMARQVRRNLNNLFSAEYAKYRFTEMSKIKDVRATESDQHKLLRSSDTQVLRDIWTAAFNGGVATMSEVADISGSDLWVVGSELHDRKELSEGNRPEFSEEVYILKPHADR